MRIKCCGGEWKQLQMFCRCATVQFGSEAFVSCSLKSDFDKAAFVLARPKYFWASLKIYINLHTPAAASIPLKAPRLWWWDFKWSNKVYVCGHIIGSVKRSFLFFSASAGKQWHSCKQSLWPFPASVSEHHSFLSSLFKCHCSIHLIHPFGCISVSGIGQKNSWLIRTQ